MAILKCKMCGGDLNIQVGETVCECEYCGSRQTVPSADNEKKLNLFARANRYLRGCEFDKAAGVYESIIADFEEEAEAYWGLVLCRYGIEYVDDPATGKKIPTCHRSSFDSVMDDKDFALVMDYSDAIARKVYREQAKQIEELRKSILEVSGKEEPYDIFISYKETDDSGERTLDSVIAQDIYTELTGKGYRVFFSRISLEDKLGTEYEPYIFAALNSAKVMLVVGTDYDHFNAVWVKNEWSRFLALIAKGEKKTLIPVFKNIDAYDMPKEFAKLSAQDMGKVGAMQDLLRGVDKIIDRKPVATAATPVVQTIVQSANGVTTESLLKRGNMFVEDGDWASANEYFDKVLDIDPENGHAYFGKLMAELKVTKPENLKNCAEPFDSKNNYIKAVRFGDDIQKAELEAANKFIRERNELNRKNDIYNKAVKTMSNAKTEAAFSSAVKLFASVPDFKDADAKIAECNNEIEKLQAKAAEQRSANTETLKKICKIIAVAATIVAVCVAAVAVTTKVVIPNYRYNSALKLMEQGKYEDAISAFKVMDGYKESNVQIEACKIAIKDIEYNAAFALMDEGKYTEAISAFEKMAGYRDSEEQITACNNALQDIDYNKALALLNDGKIIEAYENLSAMHGYRDSAEKANQIFKQYKTEKLKVADVGDIVYFGEYEQDNNTSNGNEHLEWLVMDKVDGKIFVISKNVISCREYDYWSWEKCRLRKWLNDDFFNGAFTTDEQSQIETTYIGNDANSEYTVSVEGNTVSDKVFLLNISELQKYMPSTEARICTATPYARSQGAIANPKLTTENGESATSWWLRSITSYKDIYGRNRKDAYNIECDGDIITSIINNYHSGVRPAMWINIGD